MTEHDKNMPEVNEKLFLPEEIDRELMTLEDALTKCFGGFEDRYGSLFVKCCGDVKYGSGVMGSDSARCEKCGKGIVMVLSPHVSPLLLRSGYTHSPSDQLIEAVGDRKWMLTHFN